MKKMIATLDDRYFRYSFLFLFGVITYFAFTPLYVPSLDEDFGDKINHIGAFAVLFVFFIRGYRRSVFAAVVVLIAYGFFIESVQYFIPNRYFSLYDIAADAIGIFAGIIIRRISF